MRILEGDWGNSQKNLLCLQEVTDRLIGHMKGHGYSFRPQITDGKGNFSQEKLCVLVGELVSGWAEKLQEYMDRDPATGESLAESYLGERRELYGLYFYLVMRCSLYEGAYMRAYPNSVVSKERTDFAFLLEQARRISRRWCVMVGPDGSKRNELYEGYDPHFGFHLYKTIVDPERLFSNSALSPWWELPDTRLDSMTNEGNMKRIFIRHLSGSCRKGRGEGIARDEAAESGEGTAPDKDTTLEEGAVRAEKAVQTENGSGEDGMEGSVCCENRENTDVHAEGAEGGPDGDDGYEDAYEDYDDYDDYDYDAYADDDEDDDPYPFPDFESKAAFEAAELERMAEEYERRDYLAGLALGFACKAEYREACKRFAALFEKADAAVLRDFSQELEMIVDLYLIGRELSPMADTNKVLDVYSRIYDGPCRQAERYERGLQWKKNQ
ncbi:hypothetical protein NSB25_16235 [Acetatifactor muris]|uniref:Uncharacterized protein n=1 Tax=Acetatifactor muris TaxID=879566 RepID=A0A2K4ZJF2_9FIRM|nr:hypothetical protein [Acetatifactor muris]MCR2048820.1 hypothetical protein [Acetatifactor muris]SOY30595.1 hypothetical protein AMURIS_03326 [Acetatifactor muris]